MPAFILSVFSLSLMLDWLVVYMNVFKLQTVILAVLSEKKSCWNLGMQGLRQDQSRRGLHIKVILIIFNIMCCVW